MEAQTLSSTVRSLPNNKEVTEQFKRHKLTIDFVKWEDTGRTKGSCWGPNISDVTLDVKDKSYPIIGTQNFVDPTMDMDISKFSVNVGNEKKGTKQMKRISFKEYLQNIDKYLSCKVDGSMFLERDEKILTSAQCCILPLKDGKVSFNVKIQNYQYDAEDPAVLCVVVSPHGTSAQLLTERGQKIYFNKCGEKASYQAERLKDVRAKAGKSLEGPMSQEEKEDNVLFVFQIPLKQKEKTRSSKGYEINECVMMCASMSMPKSKGGNEKSMSRSRGIDHAQLSVGESEGDWKENRSITIKRDERFPIRCTIQYYRVTDTNEIPDEVIEEISGQVWKFYDLAPHTEKGSLVVENSKRVTEADLPSRPVTSGSFFNF